MAGHPLQGGVGDEDVDGLAAGRPVAQVGDLEVDRRRRSRGPASIISGLESTPRTSASGQRSASSAVRLPGPQPRSTTVAGVVGVDPGDQLDERPAALVGVGEVALGVPGVLPSDVEILHIRDLS